MIPASTYFPSTSCITTAASSIQGMGAHSFSIAIRAGWDDVSGMELGPNWSYRRRASSLLRPSAGLAPDRLGEASTAAGTVRGEASDMLAHLR